VPFKALNAHSCLGVILSLRVEFHVIFVFRLSAERRTRLRAVVLFRRGFGLLRGVQASG